MEVWTGEFGSNYTARNQFEDASAFNAFYIERFGFSRDELNKLHLDRIPRNARIVEVGCNVGNQLDALSRMGFSHLYGVELQQKAVEIAHRNRPGLSVVQGSAFDLPFRDGFSDIVFTNNVLIHIAPDDLPRVMDEMHRVSRGWIWGFEYFSPSLVEVNYRGKSNLLWKGDYCRMFLDRFADLSLEDARIYSYKNEDSLADKMYLLKKSA
ncbi:MAG TPA: methyltransferase domain-containing protein [Hyphomicrobiales bacterium]|nr:methyltransferase domain-containing protein [Hyphomicrobiales bacterium]